MFQLKVGILMFVMTSWIFHCFRVNNYISFFRKLLFEVRLCKS